MRGNVSGGFESGNRASGGDGGPFFANLHALPGAEGAFGDLQLIMGVFGRVERFAMNPACCGVDSLQACGGALVFMATVKEKDIIKESHGAAPGEPDEHVPVFNGADGGIEATEIFIDGSTEADEPWRKHAGMVDDGFEGGGLLPTPRDEIATIEARTGALECGKVSDF